MQSATIETLVLAQADAGDAGISWWQTIQSGGVVGYIIIALSTVAVALIIMHFVQIRRKVLLPPNQIEDIDAMLARHDVNGALEYCINPENDSYLTRILAAGLTRFQKSAFGAFEIKNALEEAGEDQTARLYRSTDALGVIGSIAPLLGLLGTVLGMVGAFESISRSAGSNYEELASSISLALVTTLMGLILAIPCIALFTYFRNRIDALASEASIEIERLTLHLESATSSGGPSTVGRVGQAAPAGGSAMSTRASTTRPATTPAERAAGRGTS